MPLSPDLFSTDAHTREVPVLCVARAMPLTTTFTLYSARCKNKTCSRNTFSVASLNHPLSLSLIGSRNANGGPVYHICLCTCLCICPCVSSEYETDTVSLLFIQRVSILSRSTYAIIKFRLRGRRDFVRMKMLLAIRVNMYSQLPKENSLSVN